jgi:hypothetical protein
MSQNILSRFETHHLQAKTRARGMSLPRTAFRSVPATSSDESSIASPRTPTGPFESPFVRVQNGPPHSQHFRDSIVSSSTSLYPQSTSTDSDFDSSFPPRPKKRIQDLDVLVHNGQADFDVDDVSYRLRLLVNNSYFLPPAHSKPSPLSLAPPKLSGEQNTKRISSPFLDFFRMGKSKSKPSTPLVQSPPAVDNLQCPILRTTSDSTTASGRVPFTQSHSTSQAPLKQASSSFQQPPANRVVVLRERMDDLMEAAKQVERDMKLRAEGHKSKSQGSVQANEVFDDIVDPTDIVDLPVPPDAELFGVQASVLHGLGPGESLGADLLADRLPPSPGMWSMSTEESTWRKAILHEAVSMSFSDSPDTSTLSTSPRSITLQSPTFRSQNEEQSQHVASSPATPKPTVLLGQRIIEPSRIDADKDDSRTLSPLSALQALQPASPVLGAVLSTQNGPSSPWRQSSALVPSRAETPAATLPLTPPPFRRHLSHPQFSMSASDITITRPAQGDPELGRDSLHAIRKVVSSPRLSASSDEHSTILTATPPLESIESRFGMLSPPLLDSTAAPRPDSARPSLTSMRGTPFTDDDDASYVTPMGGDIDDDAPRPSMSLSIPSIGRLSMEDCERASPTVSAFEDAVFGSCRSPSPLLFRRSYIGAIGAPPSPIPSSRPDVISPPPRASSSVDGTILPPPPRAPGAKPVYCPRPSQSSGRSSASSNPLQTALEESEAEIDPNFSPATVTQSHSLLPSVSERRGRQPGLSLLIPPEIIPAAIHSAPAPASPTAFFDRIQSHPNAMDDLETSDESDTEDLALTDSPSAMEPRQLPPPPKPLEVFAEPRSKPGSTRTSFASSRSSRSSRPSFMRLGNHSTPHLTPSDIPDESESFLSFDVPDRRLPVGHIVAKDNVRSRAWKKASKGKGLKSFPVPRRESEDLQPIASPSNLSLAQRPATSSGPGEKTGESRFQRESLQKFDGMLLSHIASERDTLKRITTNFSNNSNSSNNHHHPSTRR